MRILVATDGSTDADGAIEWVLQFPLPADAMVEVVTVIAQVALSEGPGPTAWSKMAAQAEGLTSVMYDGEHADIAHVKASREIIALAEAIGS